MRVVLFFKTREPIEPISFVRKICEDAANGIEQQRCRFVRRLTPITATAKATERGLEDVARQVMAPHFHVPDQAAKKVSLSSIVALSDDAPKPVARNA
jgi:tRNA acetyltransferase TAN1